MTDETAEFTASVHAGVAASLSSARAALEGGDGGAALDALLAAWRAVRAPELADLVADLSARLATQRSLPPARQITQALLNWISRARALDPCDLDMLLDEFAALYRRCRPFQLAPCLDELEHRGDDPRLGPRLVEFIADAQVSGGSARKVWTRMGQLVALTGDPRIVKPLAALVGQPGANPHHTEFLTERLPGYLARLEARLTGLPTSLDAVHIPICEQLAGLIQRAELREGTPTGKPTSRAQMLDAIRADPGADDIRLIYADWLQERGDPHGEFIALQYQRAHKPPSRKAAARERKLLEQHRNQWLGGLEKIVYKRSVVFERGFLSQCEIKPLKLFQMKTEAEHVEWATVERVTFANDNHSVISPHMRAIREMRNVCDRGLVTLCRDHPDLPVVELSHRADAFADATPATRGLAELATCEGLPALRHLRLYGYGHMFHDGNMAGAPWLWRSPIAQRLETFTTRFAPLGAFLAHAPPVHRFRMGEEWSGVSIEVRRDARGRLGHAILRVNHCHPNSVDALREALADVPAHGLSSMRIEVTGTAAELEPIATPLRALATPLTGLEQFELVRHDPLA